MDKPFEINFDFPLAHSNIIVFLKATAQLHHSDPYYVVDHFHVLEPAPGSSNTSVLPPQEIKKIDRGGTSVWVHRDSERETMLSMAIGKAIDKVATA